MKISKVRKVKTPERGTSKSAGIDFFIPENFPLGSKIKEFGIEKSYEELPDDQRVSLFPGSSVLIPSGIKAKVPEGYMLMANDKSGVCSKLGLKVGAKIVDEDYQGEIHLHLIHLGDDTVPLEPNMKIVQFILVPVNYEGIEVVPEGDLFREDSERGTGGFGSTGK